MISTFHHHKFAKSQLTSYSKTLTSTHPRLPPRLDVLTEKGNLQILWVSIQKEENTKQFFFLWRKNLLEVGWYGTVTNPLMDSSKSYINREPTTLVGRSCEIGQRQDIRLTSKPSLHHHFSLYLLLQYIFKLLLCSELSLRGPKLGPHH